MKYYIKSGTLELILSTSKPPLDAACMALWETNQHDVIDEHFYIDERGYRNYVSADSKTVVLKSHDVAAAAGWNSNIWGSEEN
jgi:hypothetical protein